MVMCVVGDCVSVWLVVGLLVNSVVVISSFLCIILYLNLRYSVGCW